MFSIWTTTDARRVEFARQQ